MPDDPNDEHPITDEELAELNETEDADGFTTGDAEGLEPDDA